MFVAASTDCFPDLPLDQALTRLADLEYSCVEITLREGSPQLQPSQVLADVDAAVQICRETHRLKPVAYLFDSPMESAGYYEQFKACCRLAKATKVVMITVPSAELGSPFNGEIERLRELVNISSVDGILVGVKTQIGRITQDPDTAIVMCDNVKGLGITLDPSHYVCGPHQNGNFEQVMKHVYHVHLRDTSKTQLQVRVGQGLVEYGKLVSQLAKVKYQRSLCVDMPAIPEVDHNVEMRKLRLLLESLL